MSTHVCPILPGFPESLTHNVAPHVGHLHTLVLSDVIARYSRLRYPDRPVLFSTGTDEHGLKIQQAAKRGGVDEQTFCDQVSQRFRVSAFSRLSHFILISRISPLKPISHTRPSSVLLPRSTTQPSNASGPNSCPPGTSTRALTRAGILSLTSASTLSRRRRRGRTGRCTRRRRGMRSFGRKRKIGSSA